MSSRLAMIERRIHAKGVRFGTKVGQIGSKWDKSGTFFLDRSEPKHTEICSAKVPNLGQLGSISPSLGPNRVILLQRSVHPANAKNVLFDVSSLPSCHNLDYVT